MRYQWGRKDPFTFATSSEHNGGSVNDYGKLPVKLYNSSNVLIHQEDNGGDNTNSKPSGGILTLWGVVASSMSETVTNPITFYYGGSGIVINQSGQSSDLYNYYWSSYSRGTDGQGTWNVANNPLWHNDYLDSYIPSRHKSIYDPCPYGYRTPSNGTYNEFKTNKGWTYGSYAGGVFWKQSWHSGLGRLSGSLLYTGGYSWTHLSTIVNISFSYTFYISARGSISVNRADESKSLGSTVRCIEDCSVVSDATEASAGY